LSTKAAGSTISTLLWEYYEKASATTAAAATTTATRSTAATATASARATTTTAISTTENESRHIVQSAATIPAISANTPVATI
jgi:hypothetical protein